VHGCEGWWIGLFAFTPRTIFMQSGSFFGTSRNWKTKKSSTFYRRSPK
jgi:hypothetical protein